VLAIALLARESCQEKERAGVSFALDLGEAAAQVRHVRVDLWSDDVSIGFIERGFGADGVVETVRWRQAVPSDHVEVTIALTMADGEVVALRRQVHAPSGAAVVIDARPRR
jgi:hypothetical protein